MNPVKSIIDYLRSSKTELEKVSWPSRQDTLRYSSLVLGVSVVVALFFATLDFGLGKVVDVMIAKKAENAVSVPAAPPVELTPTETPTVTPSAPATPAVPGLDVEGTTNQ